MVSLRERRIEVHLRGPDGRWTVTAAGAGESLPLTALAGVLSVDEIYGNRQPRSSRRVASRRVASRRVAEPSRDA